MSNTAYLPISRGFDTSFGYLGGSEDHWTHIAGDGIDFWNSTKPAEGYNGTYGDILYNEIAVNTIKEHSMKYPNDRFFIYYAMQTVHDPQEAPQKYLSLYPQNMYARRKTMDAMAV